MTTLFVTGTDTGVGKTLISKALIEHYVAKGFHVAAMKPVAAGAEDLGHGLRNDDAEILMNAANTPFSYSQINPYVFEEAIAPHIAAAHQNASIKTDVLDEAFEVLVAGSNKVIIEGAGGWQVPLNPSLSFADWVGKKQWPLVLVVGIRLGCINHAKLTYLDILQKKNPLLGWVANTIDAEVECEAEVIQCLTEMFDIPLLGKVPFLAEPEQVDITQYLTLDALP